MLKLGKMPLALVMVFGLFSAAAAEDYIPVTDLLVFGIMNGASYTCLRGMTGSNLEVHECGSLSGFGFKKQSVAPTLPYGVGWFQITTNIGNYGYYCLQAGHGNGAASNDDPLIVADCDVNEPAQIWRNTYRGILGDISGVPYHYNDNASGKCITKGPENNEVVMYTCDPSNDVPHQTWLLQVAL